MNSFNQISNEAYEQAARRNQLQPDLTATLIAKLQGEASECLDAHLKGRNIDLDYFFTDVNDKNFYTEFETKVKNSVGDELADIVLYAAIIAKQKGIDLDRHIELKMKYNSMRP